MNRRSLLRRAISLASGLVALPFPPKPSADPVVGVDMAKGPDRTGVQLWTKDGIALGDVYVGPDGNRYVYCGFANGDTIGQDDIVVWDDAAGWTCRRVEMTTEEARRGVRF